MFLILSKLNNYKNSLPLHHRKYSILNSRSIDSIQNELTHFLFLTQSIEIACLLLIFNDVVTNQYIHEHRLIRNDNTNDEGLIAITIDEDLLNDRVQQINLVVSIHNLHNIHSQSSRPKYIHLETA